MFKYLLESLPRERGPAHERSECFGCSECSGYHHRVFDTAVRRLGKSLPRERSERFGYHSDGTTACVTGRYIDIA